MSPFLLLGRQHLTELLVVAVVEALHASEAQARSVLDAGMVFGTGFAPFRGGPINYARERGVDAVIAALQLLAEHHGERFEPHAGWSSL